MKPDISSTTRPTLGAALRSIRRERGLSLAAASSLTGFPVATLSKVENGKRSLTYDKLLQVANGLSIDISRLFSDHEASASNMMAGRRSVQLQNEGFVMEAGVYTYNYLAHDLVKKRFTPVTMILHARSIGEFEELLRHDGDEFALVLEGEVILHTDVYAPLRLKQGQSVYFDCSTGHAYLNAGEGPAKILCIASTADPPRVSREFPSAKKALSVAPTEGSQRPPAKAPRGDRRLKAVRARK